MAGAAPPRPAVPRRLPLRAVPAAAGDAARRRAAAEHIRSGGRRWPRQPADQLPSPGLARGGADRRRARRPPGLGGAPARVARPAARRRHLGRGQPAVARRRGPAHPARAVHRDARGRAAARRGAARPPTRTWPSAAPCWSGASTRSTPRPRPTASRTSASRGRAADHAAEGGHAGGGRAAGRTALRHGADRPHHRAPGRGGSLDGLRRGLHPPAHRPARRRPPHRAHRRAGRRHQPRPDPHGRRLQRRELSPARLDRRLAPARGDLRPSPGRAGQRPAVASRWRRFRHGHISSSDGQHFPSAGRARRSAPSTPAMGASRRRSIYTHVSARHAPFHAALRGLRRGGARHRRPALPRGRPRHRGPSHGRRRRQ